MEVEEKEINISESNDLATEQDYYQFKQILLYFVHILRANAELEPFNEGEYLELGRENELKRWVS